MINKPETIIINFRIVIPLFPHDYRGRFLGLLTRDADPTVSVAVPFQERSDRVIVGRIPISIIRPGFARQVAGGVQRVYKNWSDHV